MTCGTCSQLAGHTLAPAALPSFGRAIAARTANAFVRWCEGAKTRPVYYRMGAFDAARSPRARALLDALLERRRR